MSGLFNKVSDTGTRRIFFDLGHPFIQVMTISIETLEALWSDLHICRFVFDKIEWYFESIYQVH